MRNHDPADAGVLAARVTLAQDVLLGAVGAQGRELFAAYAEIAAALPQGDETAVLLMQRFAQASLLPEDAGALARLQSGRGEAWLRALLGYWTGGRPRVRDMANWLDFSSDGGTPWPVALPRFMQACLYAGLSSQVLTDWLDAALVALKRMDAFLERATPAQLQAERSEHLGLACQLVLAMRCMPVDEGHRVAALVGHVVQQPRVYPLLGLADFVLAAGAQAAALARDVTKALQAALAEPERTAGDWRLHGIEWQCGCTHCLAVRRWAETEGAQPLVLPLAEGLRDHVETSLRAAAAPVQTDTLREGRPYKLRMRKPGDLHAREGELRALYALELARLEAGTF